MPHPRRKPLITPAIGQTWSLLGGSRSGGHRVSFRISEIATHPNGELRATGPAIPSGKPMSVLVSTLRRGLRNARLDRDSP
jgi:hypothetical protein